MTCLSVTISRTAPNLEVWLSLRAAMPSNASRRQDTRYAMVQYRGWKLMKCNDTAAKMIRVYPVCLRDHEQHMRDTTCQVDSPMRFGTKKKTFST